MDNSSTSSTYTPDSASISSGSSRQYHASQNSSSSLRRQLPVAIPSYMSYHDGTTTRSTHGRQPPPLETRSPAPTAATETVRNGLLLIVVTGKPIASLLSYITTLLRRGSYASIAIVGNSSHQDLLKQLKMDVYATIGRLRQEAAIYVHVRNEWTDDIIDGIIREVIEQNPNLQAVLAVPLYPNQSRPQDGILEATQDHLAHSWQTSLGLLHSVARHTLRRFPVQTPRSGLFLLADEAPQSPLGIVSKGACDALIKQLAMEYETRNLVIGHAEEILVSTARTAETSLDDPMYLPAQDDRFVNTDDFAPSESPTRLWNMWALQDEMVSVK